MTFSCNKHPERPRVERWIKKLSAFFLGQGISQVMGMLSGFFLLRWMPVEEYAIFTLAFAVQCIFVNVVDLGFSSAITPLSGSQAEDPVVLGRYAAAARSLRRRMFPWAATGAGCTLVVIGGQHGWKSGTIASLCVTIITALWIYGTYNIRTNALIAAQRIGTVYRIQGITAVVRLAAYWLAHLAGPIAGVFAIGLSAATTFLNSWLFREPASKVSFLPATSLAADRREMTLFILPLVPITLFGTFQGQVTVFLISIFGNVTSLAETGALSRINQLFTPATFLISWVIAPYFARLTPCAIGRRYYQILGVAALTFGFLVMSVRIYPEPLLWLLGRNYDNLRLEVFLATAAGSFSSLGSLAFGLLHARKLVKFHSSGILIFGQVISQAIVLPFLDLSTTAGAIGVGLAAGFGFFVSSVLMFTFRRKNS